MRDMWPERALGEPDPLMDLAYPFVLAFLGFLVLWPIIVFWIRSINKHLRPWQAKPCCVGRDTQRFEAMP